MKDINDIFSKNIVKIAQPSGLTFDQPVFETKTGPSPAAKNQNETSATTETTAIEEQVSETKPVPVEEDSTSKTFAQIVGEELDDQTASLIEAHKQLTLVQIGNRNVHGLAEIKRLVEEAISTSVSIKKKSSGVRVI